MNASVRTHDLNLLLIGDPGTGKTTLFEYNRIDLYFGDSIQDKYTHGTHILFINSLREQFHSTETKVKTFYQSTKSVILIKKNW